MPGLNCNTEIPVYQVMILLIMGAAHAIRAEMRIGALERRVNSGSASFDEITKRLGSIDNKLASMANDLEWLKKDK